LPKRQGGFFILYWVQYADACVVISAKGGEGSSRIQNLDVPLGDMTNTSLLAARILHATIILHVQKAIHEMTSENITI
jgi:hypothetical protein